MQNHKKLVSAFLAIVLIFGLFFITASAEDSYITLDNAKATITSAKYDEANGFVTDLSMGDTKVTYMVGDDVNGNFDVYLEVSRQTLGFGTTHFLSQ